MGYFNRDNNSGGRPSYGNRSYGGGSSDREMFKATCASCGKSCDVPFKPTGARPVYCNDCFKKNAPQDEGRGRFESRDRRGGGNDRPMFDAVCDNCGNNCKLPFMPREGKASLCSKCFEEKGGDPRSNMGLSANQLTEINAKLDRILELLSPTPKAPKKEKVSVAVEELSPEVEISLEADIPQATTDGDTEAKGAEKEKKIKSVKKAKAKKATAKKA